MFVLVAAGSAGVAADSQATRTSSEVRPPAAAPRQLIEVGKDKAIKTLAAASAMARDGAVIEVDAGDYVGDVAVWNQNDLTLRARGGPVRLVANGKSAEGKGIWVVKGQRVLVQGFEFVEATVSDRNGAGIRLERGSLHVRNCRFLRNQNGILTANDPTIELTIEDSEFGFNGAGDGQSHNLYVGRIGLLSVTGSYFHHANRGHLLKSRAKKNLVFYSRLTDETGGRASYELEFPNGGEAYVIGNIIQQIAETENPHLVSFGVEGNLWPSSAIYMVNNTLLNERRNGVFLRVSQGTRAAVVANNILYGPATWDIAIGAVFHGNPEAQKSDFASFEGGDWRLAPGSRLVGRVVEPGQANGISLRPTREYRHPAHSVPVDPSVLQPGAMQSGA